MTNPSVRARYAPTEEAGVYENVLVVRRSEFGWHCVIEGRAVFLGQREIAPDATMPREGERGRVTLTADAAENLNLRSRHP
jgi:hypothetical protein